MKRIVLISVFAVLMLSIASAQVSLSQAIDEYSLLVDDLENHNTYGYKGHLSIENRVGTSITNIAQGSLLTTGLKLDLAILGIGFFRMRSSDGKMCFTRNGRLVLTSDLELTNEQGFPFYDPIRLAQPQIEIQVAPNGNVYGISSAGENHRIGTIRLFTFSLDKVKQNIGTVFYLKDGESGEVCGDTIGGKIMQGTLEMSNVLVYETCFRLLFLINEIDSNLLGHKDTKKELLVELIQSLYSNEYSMKNTIFMARVEAAISPNRAAKANMEYISENKFLEAIIPFLKVNYDK